MVPSLDRMMPWGDRMPTGIEPVKLSLDRITTPANRMAS